MKKDRKNKKQVRVTKKRKTASVISALKSKEKQKKAHEKAFKSLIAKLNSNLTATHRKLKKVHSNAKKTRSKLSAQLDKLRAEKESLLYDLQQAKIKAYKAAAERYSEKSSSSHAEKNVNFKSAMKSIAAQSVGVLEVGSAAVTKERTPAFASVSNKIILKNALDDISSNDATVRAGAAKTLACIRHKLSVQALIVRMTSEPSALVRQECIKALTALETSKAVPVVECALTDKAASVRLAAVWALYRLTGPRSTSALIRMCADEDTEVRRRAATCIGWLGQEKLAVKLLPLLDDKSASVRRAAAEAMGNLHNRQMLSPLIERLNDPDKLTRKVILRTVEKITGKKMGSSLAKNKKGFEHLTSQWHKWLKKELLG